LKAQLGGMGSLNAGLAARLKKPMQAFMPEALYHDCDYSV
jgi:hypothetical protein